MKKRTMIVVICVILLSIFALTSLSFIIRQTSTDNIITFGSIKIKTEEKEIMDDGSEVTVNNNDVVDITAKNNINRKIVVSNVGNHPAYIRVRIEFDDSDIANYVSVQKSGEDWIYEDGLYYYKRKLDKGEKTTDLYLTMQFDATSIANYFPNSKLNLKIDTEAVQSENNADNVLEAAGWPNN